jgi:hypothetical protein
MVVCLMPKFIGIRRTACKPTESRSLLLGNDISMIDGRACLNSSVVERIPTATEKFFNEARVTVGRYVLDSTN